MSRRSEKPSPAVQTAIVIGFFGLFLGFGVLAAVDLVLEVRRGLAARDWPVAEGTVVLATSRAPNSSLKRLEYAYAVDGTEYSSTKAAFVRVPYTNPLHEVYERGQAVAVRYDPDDPARAVLEPGAPALGVLAEAVVPLVMLSLGGAGLFYGLGFGRR